MKTAAIYARVSSDRQKEEQTIASQTSALRGYAAEHEYVIPDGYLFEDEGWSGATLVRPGLERLRDIAAQGTSRRCSCTAPIGSVASTPIRSCSSRNSPATASPSSSCEAPRPTPPKTSCSSNSKA